MIVETGLATVVNTIYSKPLIVFVEEDGSNPSYGAEDQISESNNEWDWLESPDSDIDSDSDFEL